ncbi:MAG: hypothetical protein EBU76_05815 [Gammaproteobacteria bacterium]|nr:hypothetical protein [Gammaproteobacteria bacterium]
MSEPNKPKVSTNNVFSFSDGALSSIAGTGTLQTNINIATDAGARPRIGTNEVLSDGPSAVVAGVEAGASKAATSLPSTVAIAGRLAQGAAIVGGINDAINVGQHVVQGNGAEATTEILGVGGQVAGAWIGAKTGATLGTATIGPGVGTVAGTFIGGTAGALGGAQYAKDLGAYLTGGDTPDKLGPPLTLPNHTPLQAPADMVARQRGRYDAGWQAIREQRFRRTQELGLLPPGTQLAAWPGLEDWNALNPTRKAYETRRMEVYAAMAETMDREIGRVRAAIKDLGVDDNTIFVFLSDNGAEPSDPYEYLSGRAWLATQYTRDTDRLGSKGAYATMGRNWAAAAVSPLATHKFFAGEGGLRVPLIIREPVRRSAIHRGFTHVTDVTPTLLEFAGVTHPGKAAGVEPPTGRSLVNVLRDGSASVRAADDTLGYELAGNAALFAGDLKLVRNQPPVGTGDWQLFDIARDPGETRDLRASRPADFARLLAAYKEYENTDGVRPLPAGYEPRDQVAMNALRRVILPSLWWPALLTIALVVGLWALLRRRNKT